MSTIIMDLCSYTRLGLTGYLLSRGLKREINDIETVDDLAIACDSQRPSVVFINEDCFIHDASNSQRIKLIINQHPNTLFIVLWQLQMFILMNIYWSEKNLLISSKSIKPESLDDIPGDILKKETTITSFFKYADVIIEPNRIEYVANVDGRSGSHSNLRPNEYQSQDRFIA